MILFRRIALCVAVLMLGLVVLAAQDDDENWITYIADNEIYLINIDGTEEYYVPNSNALMIQWASDREWLLVASNSRLAEEGIDPTINSHLFRVDAYGTNSYQITTEPVQYLRHLALSPDNEWIAYTSCPDGYMHDCQLYKIRSDGTDFAHIDASPGYNQYLSWSPDSSAFLFSAYNGRSRNIYRMNPEESEVELLTEGWSMAWSPDGEWIAFILEYNVYRMRPDGTDIEQLTANFDVGENLSWSPDSEWILFEAREGTRIDLYRMNADGTDQKQLAEGRNAVVSPDGEWILFNFWNEERDDLYRMRADGSDLQQLTDTSAIEHHTQWQPLRSNE